MSNLKNQVQLIGNLGDDLQVIELEKGKITKFSLATTESYKDSNGEKQQETQWHKIASFGKLAEITSEYLSKGDKVLAQGKLKYSNYQDKEGVKRQSTEIVLSEVEFLKTKKSETVTV